jgi:hypothetical protein
MNGNLKIVNSSFPIKKNIYTHVLDATTPTGG